MKMQVQESWKYHKKINILVLIVFLLALRCNDKEDKNETAFGKSFFVKNCSICHTQNDIAPNTPSIVTLSSYDSLKLISKLNQIKVDRIHSNYIKPLTYSNNEINALIRYIKDYTKPHY